MGYRPLGQRWIRRIARVTGHDIVWAVGRGSYTHVFTTADHRHGVIEATPPYDWAFLDECPHLASCRELFPPTSEV